MVKQAGAVLGQAQLKLGRNFTSINLHWNIAKSGSDKLSLSLEAVDPQNCSAWLQSRNTVQIRKAKFMSTQMTTFLMILVSWK